MPHHHVRLSARLSAPPPSASHPLESSLSTTSPEPAPSPDVLIYALYWSSRGGVAVDKGWQPRVAFLWRTFPKFVLGFIAVSTIATTGLLTKPAITSLGNLSKWAFLLCFAGVGLNFDLRELARAGVRPLIVAALGLVVVAACSLGLVLLTSGWLTG